MTELQRLQDVKAETKRFLDRLEICIADEKSLEDRLRNNPRAWVEFMPVHRAAAKRASLDLWRRLAAYRKGE